MSDTKQCEFCEKDMERGKRPFHLECYGEARSIFQNYSAMLAENASLLKEREELRSRPTQAEQSKLIGYFEEKLESVTADRDRLQQELDETHVQLLAAVAQIRT